MMDEQGQPWDKQPEENSLWYGRFREYLLHRQLLPIYNSERGRAGKGPLSSTPAAWKQAKQRFDWEARAIAWDASRQNAQEAEWLKKWGEYRHKLWSQAQELANRADLMLRHPHVTQTIERVYVARHEGEQVPQSIVIKPARWTLRDVPAFYKQAALLARQAAGDVELAIDYLTALGYTITEPGAEEGDDDDDRHDD